MVMAKHPLALKKLAEVGASVRISELKAELDVLYKYFPGLRSGKGSAEKPALGKAKKRSTMSAAQKKAVSVRMKKYWAARKSGDVKR